MTRTLTRRGFLSSLLGTAGGMLAASLPLAGCTGGGPYLGAPAGLRLFTPKQWSVLDAAARRIVPDLPTRPGGGLLAVATSADRFFASGNPRLRANLAKLMDSLEDLPWLAGTFQPFTRMTPAAQDTYLANWSASAIGAKREAFGALLRLVQLIYYMDSRAWPAIRFPGPWVGRVDVGFGLDNQGALAANPNPNVFRVFTPGAPASQV